jgi:hypothetical protein
MILTEFNKTRVYDECDLVVQIIYNELKFDNDDAEWLFNELYVDEVQDFTQCEVLLICSYRVANVQQAGYF